MGPPQANTPGDKPMGFLSRYLTTNNNPPAGKSPLMSPTSPQNSKATPKLSVVSEEKLSRADNTFSFGSKDSTLRNNSDFEVDSLETEVVLMSTNNSTVNGGRTATAGGDPQQRLLPPPHNPNVMVNYADPHGSIPLSPIWNQIGYFQTESSSSTNSEYITSYIGPQTPLPSVLSPDFKTKVLGGGGARRGSISSDSDPDPGPGGREPSSGESGGEGGEGSKDGCLKWKRGRLLGKGAYGKVWEGLLSSAHMIAVKEVELDTDSLERAQSVSTIVLYERGFNF